MAKNLITPLPCIVNYICNKLVYKLFKQDGKSNKIL
jgi:hypothetical protein